MPITIYHGTTWQNAKNILKEGFTQQPPNWPIAGRPGFAYLSLAYGPFYAEQAKRAKKWGALVKCEVEIEDCYPEDDFLMSALGKPVYTEEDLYQVNIEDFKHVAIQSLEKMGNVAVRFEDVKIVGATKFSMERLLLVADPVIAPINYFYCGQYYRELSDHIYDNGNFITFDSNDSMNRSISAALGTQR